MAFSKHLIATAMSAILIVIVCAGCDDSDGNTFEPEGAAARKEVWHDKVMFGKKITPNEPPSGQERPSELQVSDAPQIMPDPVRQVTQKLEHYPADPNAMQQLMFKDGQLLKNREQRNHILWQIITQNQTDLNDFRRRFAIGLTGPDETVAQLELTNGTNVELRVAGATNSLYKDVKNFATEDVSIGNRTVSIPNGSHLDCHPSQYPGMQECHQ